MLQPRFDAGYFSIQAVLGILLAERPESKTNPYAAMFFVDDAVTRSVERNAGVRVLGMEELLCGIVRATGPAPWRYPRVNCNLTRPCIRSFA